MALLPQDTATAKTSDAQPLKHNEYSLATLTLAQLCQLKHENIQHQHRFDVLLALRAALVTASPPVTSEQAHRLVALARYLCDWPTLLDMQNRGLWQASSAEKVQPEIQLGWFDLALAQVENALQTHCYDMELVITRQELQHVIDTMPYPLAALKNGAVSLTPLQFYHVADFGWQYGDAKIAQLCNLPLFPSAQHWINWLHQCQQEQQRHLFAVMHEDFGLIGSVSLQVFDGLGFFYYWLGSDFQGQGLGPKAVDILMRLGQRYLGMRCCYAKVFDYNPVSNRAIAKLGFERLPFKALPPSESEVFYFKGGKCSTNTHYQDLQTLLSDLNSDIHLVKT
ncbi:GNAT family protein [Rheinheimera baltica]|uniref:GNAT family protein n=1 Tax=Rheinheimera baltica TaxID=67576 RepID=A0ABT9HWH4_9GAMM|nr:GNAT family protein [Rheinheimera baltica]MDP5135031.1 GNAT family protein [Rheinheimera baltica]